MKGKIVLINEPFMAAMKNKVAHAGTKTLRTIGTIQPQEADDELCCAAFFLH